MNALEVHTWGPRGGEEEEEEEPAEEPEDEEAAEEETATERTEEFIQNIADETERRVMARLARGRQRALPAPSSAAAEERFLFVKLI